MWRTLQPDLVLAFTMGLHERLGEGSPVQILTADIIEREIARVLLWSCGQIANLHGEVVELKGHFRLPHFLTIDEEGNIFVLDEELESILTFSPHGALVQKVKYDTKVLQVPRGLVGDRGQLFTCDWGMHYVVKLAAWWPTGKLDSVEIDRSGKLCYPYGVAMTSERDLVVTDSGRSRVVVMKRGGGEISIESEAFVEPMSVVVDKEDNIYVTDREENLSQGPVGKVILMTLSGELVRSFTSWFDCERKTLVPLGEELAIALDPWGYIFISDYLNGTVMCLNSDFEGQGYSEFDGSELKPFGLVCDAGGNLLLTDERQARVLMIPHSFFRQSTT